MTEIKAGMTVIATHNEPAGITEGKTYEVLLRNNGRLYINGDKGDELDLDNNESNLVPVIEPDNVNQPNHYTQSKFETIEVIEEITAGYSDGFVAYALGNSLKYIARAPYKHGDNGLEDLRKSARYLQYAIERIEKTNSAK